MAKERQLNRDVLIPKAVALARAGNNWQKVAAGVGVSVTALTNWRKLPQWAEAEAEWEARQAKLQAEEDDEIRESRRAVLAQMEAERANAARAFRRALDLTNEVLTRKPRPDRVVKRRTVTEKREDGETVEVVYEETIEKPDIDEAASLASRLSAGGGLKFLADAAVRGAFVPSVDGAQSFVDEAFGGTTFREFVDHVEPGYVWSPHTELLAQECQDIVDGKSTHQHVLVNFPPGAGKTTLLSKLLPAYALYRDPALKVHLGSYDRPMANAASVAAREYFIRAGGVVQRGKANMSLWYTNQGGYAWTSSPTSGILGKHWDLSVMDDCLPSELGALNAAVLEKAMGWWDAVQRRVSAYSDHAARACVTVGQRLSHIDLFGVLMERELEAKCFHVPALGVEAEDLPEWPASYEVVVPDMTPGESFAPALKSTEVIEEEREACESEFIFQAVYQGNPSPEASSGLITESAFQYAAIPDSEYADMRPRVRSFDLAWSLGGDYTASTLGSRFNDIVYVEEVDQFRVPPAQLPAKIAMVCQDDHPDTVVTLPIDPAAGEGAAVFLQNELHKLMPKRRIELLELPSVGGVRLSKTERALPFTSAVGLGVVVLVRGDWNKKFIKQVTEWGVASKDSPDMLDSAADMYRFITT